MEGATTDEQPSAWNTRDLAAVLIAAVGAWQFARSCIGAVETAWLPPGVTPSNLLWGVSAAVGIALFLGARRLARIVCRMPVHGPVPDSVVGLLGGLFAAVGVLVALRGFEDATRTATIAAAELAAGRAESVWEFVRDWRLPMDVVNAGVGTLLVVRSGALARRWARWTRNA